jgi:hypothetical protein
VAPERARAIAETMLGLDAVTDMREIAHRLSA